jgi:hypothetical protein
MHHRAGDDHQRHHHRPNELGPQSGLIRNLPLIRVFSPIGLPLDNGRKAEELELHHALLRYLRDAPASTCQVLVAPRRREPHESSSIGPVSPE